jgi:hypothetical protein
LVAGQINAEIRSWPGLKSGEVLLKVSPSSAVGSPDHFVLLPAPIARALAATTPKGFYRGHLSIASSSTLTQMPASHAEKLLGGMLGERDTFSVYGGALEGIRVSAQPLAGEPDTR